MSVLDHAYNLTLLVIMVIGLASVIYTLPKMKPWWKPLYWFGIPLAGLPILMIVTVVGVEMFGLSLLPRTWVVPMLKLVMFILGLQLIAVPFVHRYEARLLDQELPEVQGDG